MDFDQLKVLQWSFKPFIIFRFSVLVPVGFQEGCKYNLGF